MPFPTVRAPSYCGCPERTTGPVMLSPSSRMAACSIWISARLQEDLARSFAAATAKASK